MHYTKDQIAELDILITYSADNTQQGLKIHSNANEEQINAVERLYYKGLVTTIDGGYLTDLGSKAAEHAQSLLLILAPHHENVAS
ncbi:hypothetical protein MNBD_GAMMA07-2115 [hydrothermal vent metagenome]|uniref:DNA-binding protein inhibitor Id-2-related protein n=1 Tax=hydrothermal vent metagenome TaxID=652676 RepID=A0A3B0WTV8_9ZZZZ